MASFSDEIVVKLGANLTGLRRGLAQAKADVGGFARDIGGKFSGKAAAGQLGGVLSGFFGIGAVLQGFRSVINASQEIRDLAVEQGRAIEPGIASVARYADQWDRAKEAAGKAAVNTLGIFTQVGEKIGESIAVAIGRAQGRTRDEVLRTIKISDEAGANADRLKKGLEDGSVQARADENAARRKAEEAANTGKVSSNFEKAEQARRRSAERAMSDEEKLAMARNAAADADRRYQNNQLSSVARSEALVEREEQRAKILELTASLEKKVTDQKEAAAKAAQADLATRNREATALKNELAAAAATVAGIQNSIATQNRDKVVPTLAQVASGERDIGQKGNATVDEIGAAEETARKFGDRAQRQFDIANDPKVSKGERDRAERDRGVAAEISNNARNRAKDLREDLRPRINSADSGGDQLAELKSAVKTLKEIEKSLKAIPVSEEGK